jgi:hypothetical protein
MKLRESSLVDVGKFSEDENINKCSNMEKATVFSTSGGCVSKEQLDKEIKGSKDGVVVILQGFFRYF